MLDLISNNKYARVNLVGFLHHTDIVKLNSVLNADISRSNSYYAICDIITEKLSAGVISEENAAEAMLILTANNKQFKKTAPIEDLTLRKHIEINYASRKHFAEKNGVSVQYVNNLIHRNTKVVKLVSGQWITLTKYNVFLA